MGGVTPKKPSSLGQLVGLMAICVIVLALTGMFGIWYSHEQAESALARMGNLTRLINAARETQVEFKIQVQLWKNILIRGQDPKDLADYTKKFHAQNDLVQKNLSDVLASPELPAALKPQVESLRNEHQALRAKYDAALAEYSGTDPASIFRADQAVRGIDQPLNIGIDQLAASLVDVEASSLKELVGQAAELYHNLRIVTLIVGSLAVACAGLLAWRALRSQA